MEYMKIQMGAKAVATPGTAVPIATPSSTATRCKMLTICAKKVGADNTGELWFGDATLASATAEGIELATKAVYTFPIEHGQFVDLADIYIDATNANDGVVYTYALIDPHV